MRVISSMLPEQWTLQRFDNLGSTFMSMPGTLFNDVERAAML